jgi:fructokinase
MNALRHRRKVVGLGEALWDIAGDEKHCGGAPVNFAYISSLLGEDAIVASRIGRDKLGEELRQELGQRGLDLHFLQLDDSLPTGAVSVTVSGDGQPEYNIHTGVAWDAMEWTPEWAQLAEETDAVSFGTLAQRCPKSRETIHAFLRKTRPDCARIFDVNLRPPFYSSDIILNSLPVANVVKVNEAEYVEIASLLGLPEVATKETLRAFAEKFDLWLVCVTRGSRGSMMATRYRVTEHPGFAVKVRDTIGAGDAFTAAMTHTWISSNEDLEQTSETANRWAAWVASQAGAMPLRVDF